MISVIFCMRFGARLLLRFVLLAGAFFALFSSPSMAAPSSNLWPHWLAQNAASTQRVDHSVWDTFLKNHVITNHPSNVFLLNYAAVPKGAQTRLNQYLAAMQGVKVSQLSRREQLPYWINLYNAKTIELILTHRPVKSIRDIKFGLFSGGPWSKKLLTVEGQALSLNDIEHRILRPIWRDSRIHYAVNCASIGCPNLMPVAFTASNIEVLLKKGAVAYINHPRGVRFDDGKLVLSSIFHWFIEDFKGNLKGVLAHVHKYATPHLQQQLTQYDKGYDHAYDWALNAP